MSRLPWPEEVGIVGIQGTPTSEAGFSYLVSQTTGMSDFGPIAKIITSYGYDTAGNLASVAYPNGVTHSYTYDPLNRLTNLAVAKSTTALAGYAYTLGPADLLPYFRTTADMISEDKGGPSV